MRTLPCRVTAGVSLLLNLFWDRGRYWVCKRAPAAVYEAMECFGGNGYVEEWGMPRLYRQVSCET